MRSKGCLTSTAFVAFNALGFDEGVEGAAVQLSLNTSMRRPCYRPLYYCGTRIPGSIVALPPHTSDNRIRALEISHILRVR
jgi:hypothetical protein